MIIRIIACDAKRPEKFLDALVPINSPKGIRKLTTIDSG